MIVAITLNRKSPELNPRKTDRVKVRDKLRPFEAKTSHDKPPFALFDKAPVQRRSNISDALEKSDRRPEERRDRKIWKFIDRQMNHYRSAWLQDAGNFAENDERIAWRIEMLKDMRRKCRAAGAVRKWNRRAVGDEKIDIRGVEPAFRVGQLVLGNIDCIDATKVRGELFRDPPGATSDFHTASSVEPVMFPMFFKIPPIARTELVKLLIRPAVGTFAILTLPR